MTKEQIIEKAQEIANFQKTRAFEIEDIYACCFNGCIEMADWLLQNIQIVKLDNAYNHDFFENHKFLCLEEQKRQLLLSLKDYIKVDEEITDFGTIVKMEVKIMK